MPPSVIKANHDQAHSVSTNHLPEEAIAPFCHRRLGKVECRLTIAS